MKKLLLAGLVLAIAGGGIAYYMWNKPHQNIAKTKPAHTLAAASLVEAYQADEAAANDRFLGQVIEVSGEITKVSVNADGSSQIMLKSNDLIASVTGNLQESETAQVEKLKAGDQVTIKGECTGMLMDVVLERCVISNKE